MAVLDAARHEAAEEVGRLERRVQAQLFLDVLQGAFESAWECPEDLQHALAELPSTAREEGRRHVLLSYLEAMRGCLREESEVGEGGAGADGRVQGRGKRRRQARQQRRGSGSEQEGSGTEVRKWSVAAWCRTWGALLGSPLELVRDSWCTLPPKVITAPSL
jgi:hypothetical protein